MDNREKATESSKFLVYAILLGIYFVLSGIETSQQKQKQKALPHPSKNRHSIKIKALPKIHQAILNNDLTALRVYINRPKLINLSAGTSGISPLGIACQSGNMEATQLLLNAGADIYQRDSHRRIPAVLALKHKQNKIIDLLFKYQKDWTQIDQDSFTLMHYAAQANNIKVLKKCLAQRVDIDKKGTKDWTALHFAAREGNTEAVIFLKENGADVSARMYYGWSPAELSALKFPRITRYLGLSNFRSFGVENLLANQPKSIPLRNLPPLHKAIAQNDSRKVTSLLVAKKNLQTIDANNDNALEYAIKKRRYRFIHQLVEAGVKINVQDFNGSTPLLNLIRQRKSKLAIFLLEKGADPNIEDLDKNTPLLLAMEKKQISVVKNLLKNDANLFCKNIFENSSLHLAVYSNSIELVNLLLTNGADVDSTNIKGEIPLHIATRARNTAIVEALLKNGSNPHLKDYSQKSSYLISRRKNDRIKKLFDNRVEIEGNNPAENPPAEAVINISSD